MKKFLIIDDHVVVRSGIKGLLAELYQPSITEEAHDGESALACLKHNFYDLVLLDIQTPNTDALGLMEYFKIKFPDLKVLVFSMSPENIYAKRFLKAGAKGFISKDAPLQELKTAITRVLNSGRYISTDLAESLAMTEDQQKDNNIFNRLSAREFEIANLLLDGQNLSSIANTLHLRVSTIGTHKARIFEKLHIKNLLQLKDLAVSYRL